MWEKSIVGKSQNVDSLGYKYLTYLSSMLGDFKVNLWDYMGVVVTQYEIKVTYSSTRGSGSERLSLEMEGSSFGRKLLRRAYCREGLQFGALGV